MSDDRYPQEIEAAAVAKEFARAGGLLPDVWFCVFIELLQKGFEPLRAAAEASDAAFDNPSK